MSNPNVYGFQFLNQVEEHGPAQAQQQGQQQGQAPLPPLPTPPSPPQPVTSASILKCVFVCVPGGGKGKGGGRRVVV